MVLIPQDTNTPKSPENCEVFPEDLKIVLNQNCTCVRVSNTFASLLGYELNEILGQHVSCFAEEKPISENAERRASNASGCFAGLWLLKSRESGRLLVRYRAKATKKEIEIEISPLTFVT